MAVKSGKTLNDEYVSIKGFLSYLKSQCIRHRDQTRDIKTTVDELLPLLREATFRLSALPTGLSAYAQQQEDDQNYDLSAELTALVVACSVSIGWIINNVPVDPVTKTLNERVMNPDGTVYLAVVDDSKAAEAVMQIQSVIDLIE